MKAAILAACLLAPLPAERWHVQPGEWTGTIGDGRHASRFVVDLQPDGRLVGTENGGVVQGTWRAEGQKLTLLVNCPGEPFIVDVVVTMRTATAIEVQGSASLCGFSPTPFVMRRKKD